MTTTKNNDRKRKAKAEPIDIDAAMARLILLRKFHELPRPTDYNIYYGGETNPTHTISVILATHGDATAWADALGIQASSRRSSVHHGAEYTNAWAASWHGWHLNIRATVALTGAPAELDADTVAGLEQVAADDSRFANDEPEPECDHQAGCPKHGDVYDCDPMPAEQFAVHAGPYDVPAVSA